jgi:hypothetical protein
MRHTAILFYVLIFLGLLGQGFAQNGTKTTVIKDDSGMKLIVDGEDFMVNGMNWDYFPIGTNYTYSLWDQPDEFIRTALDHEMKMLQNMGVNAIRVYTGIQPKWIEHIYKKYGIYTMLNHSFGRYGLTLDGVWTPNTEYSDPRVKELLLKEVTEMVAKYQNTPGLLFYLLGNENNYGLFWGGAETEDIPVEDRKSTKRAESMYKLFNEAAIAMKEVSTNQPVAMCNGDLLFIEIIEKECKDVDIFGVNMYRGVSFGDAFEEVKNRLNKPIVFTEFGADAFNVIDNDEDQKSQAYYMVGNWKEIYENAYGMGKTGNSIGGFTFQFSDGWWKYKQTSNLDIHDNNASWSNGGYQSDFIEGKDNMNEEWFGICAKGPTSERGLYKLFPRAAYYALQQAHLINPYEAGASVEKINEHFESINLMEAVLKARGDKAALNTEELKKIRLSQLRGEFTTFSTGGKRISTPKNADPTSNKYPSELGFDHMESIYLGVEAKPNESFRANVTFNILGNVAENPIDEIFYENRGRVQTVQQFDIADADGEGVELTSSERLKVYQGEIEWNTEHFDMKSFYRTGHYHWGDEGDFFGLYPEANYGPNLDIYNGNAPFGFEFEGKKKFDGLKLAFGPELWWGANPAFLVKYSKSFAGFKVTGIYHEDVDEQAPAVTSFAVPTPPNRRATIHIERKIGIVKVEIGGIWSGQPRVDEMFQLVDGEDGNYTIYQDNITMDDTWGGKAKVEVGYGPVQWYAQGAAMGLVAEGGADYTKTFTGWHLKDAGTGNQFNFLTGFTYSLGDFQIAPNFLWQKPIVGPIPGDVQAPGRPRNILDDPFAVRKNRETVGGELLFTFDPTPATWMYDWNSDEAEDAPIAASVGFIYRHHPTTQDAAIGIFPDGRTTFAFPGAPPARDLWEAHGRIVSKFTHDLGFIANLYVGEAEANGSDERLINRYGADVRVVYKKAKLISMVKVNDWGPYDYHRDYNLTYPLQVMADLSIALGKRKWFNMPETRIGMRGTWRALNEYSPRYCPGINVDETGEFVCDPTLPGEPNGSEWEIRTYLHFMIGR